MELKFDCAGVEWALVSETLKAVGMAYHAPDVHRKAFENSYAVVFVYDQGRMIGFGRAISDGAYQAALYDVAVIPELQKMGTGKLIITNLLARVPQCNVILYASPGKEGFYRKLGLRQMKTGMALFQKADYMKERGFTE